MDTASLHGKPYFFYGNAWFTGCRKARRAVQQGGAYVNDERVPDMDYMVSEADLTEGGILLRVGKKRFHRLVVT